MTPPDALAALVTQRLGVPAAASYGDVVAQVPRQDWQQVVTAARDDEQLHLTLFDMLTAVDDGDDGIEVVLRLWSPELRHGLRLHTRCPAQNLRVPTLTGVFAGASWHERATAEMFGVGFDGHPNLAPLLLPDGVRHPLRKSVLLESRLDKPWPGAPAPGQSAEDAAVEGAASPRRRRLPPGVPR